MLKKCLVCQATAVQPSLAHWIEEKHYQSSQNTIKEVFIGSGNPPNNAAKYGRQSTGSVYYCSWQCFNQQLDQEETKDWAKGDCPQRGQSLVAINDQCANEKHQAEAHYFPLGEKKGDQT